MDAHTHTHTYTRACKFSCLHHCSTANPTESMTLKESPFLPIYLMHNMCATLL